MFLQLKGPLNHRTLAGIAAAASLACPLVKAWHRRGAGDCIVADDRSKNEISNQSRLPCAI
jgi:hypothetical protein